MLFEAAKKYNIDLSESWMIGDGKNDVEAGRNAGCKVAYIGQELLEGVCSYSNLLECVKDILNV